MHCAHPNINNPDHVYALKQILTKDIKFKSDVNFMMKILDNVKFFQEQSQTLQTDLYIELLKHLKYQKLEKNQIVFRQGAIGNCYYIILSGSVDVFLQQKMQTDLNLK